MKSEKKTLKIKKIPYGISDYELIRKENCYYVDKTQYLKTLNKAGRYLFFIRPRRFGKSLFISMMGYYYDILYKERFEEFFKGTWIYDNPTNERGKYLVLKFNFSLIDPGMKKTEESFLLYLKEKSTVFLSRYKTFLEVDDKLALKEIEKMNSPSDILRRLINFCNISNRKVYVIIDEYDNFANTILSTSGADAYEELTHGAGSFRSFFNVLKGGTTETGAPVTRSFITGVSPITMDDVTSGYNIGKNVSLEPDFNRMLGFTRDDVLEIIEYYRSKGLVKHPTGYLLEIMTEWYGNYLFSEYEDDDVKLFNPDMILYLMDNYLTRKNLPNDLIDRNVRIDYGKLRYLITMDKGKGKEKRKITNGNFDRLKEILEKGETSAKIEKGFPLEELADTDNFISLLFYLGLLTIESVKQDKMQLKIPNETMKRLYYDYIKKGYRETGIFDLDLSKYSDLMSDMAYEGKWEPLFDYITGCMRESMSLRDLITGEKSIQAFLNVYLGLSNLYIIHPEKEMNKGYADIVTEPFLARYEGIKYSYILEIKYANIGVKPGDARVQKLKGEAEKQLKKYSTDKKFKKNIDKTTLIKLVLIFSGHELIYIGEVEN